MLILSKSLNAFPYNEFCRDKNKCPPDGPISEYGVWGRRSQPSSCSSSQIHTWLGLFGKDVRFGCCFEVSLCKHLDLFRTRFLYTIHFFIFFSYKLFKKKEEYFHSVSKVFHNRNVLFLKVWDRPLHYREKCILDSLSVHELHF